VEKKGPLARVRDDGVLGGLLRKKLPGKQKTRVAAQKGRLPWGGRLLREIASPGGKKEFAAAMYRSRNRIKGRCLSVLEGGESGKMWR